MDRKGMRDVPSMQTAHRKKQQDGREQMVTEFARLEHERARLERELQLWTKKKYVTEGMLERVRNELEVVQQNLLLSQSESSTQTPKGIRGRTKAKSSDSEQQHDSETGGETRWREMEIGY